MRIRGKLFVAEVTSRAVYGGAEQGDVILRAASRGAKNAAWASATPNAEVKLTVNNPTAFVALRDRLGDECYVDLDFDVAQPGDGHAFEPSPEGHYNYPRCAECGDTEEAHEQPTAG